MLEPKNRAVPTLFENRKTPKSLLLLHGDQLEREFGPTVVLPRKFKGNQRLLPK